MKRKLIKTITLLTFLGLIGVFLAYRTGHLEYKNMIQLHSDVSQLNTLKIDSLPNADSIQQKTILMPSSKVLILTNEESKLKKLPDSIMLQRILMGSSKSGIIVDPKKIDSAQVLKKQ